jgi:hypothetical protein
MKKLLLTFTLIFSGCKSVDDQGRLEKVRISVPAFFQIEMDYYKDKENKGKGSVSTDTVNGYPKLMDMIRK